MTFYETVSDFFDAEGDFEENLVDDEPEVDERDMESEDYGYYWNEVEQGRYDDDPNPYHGDYSEM